MGRCVVPYGEGRELMSNMNVSFKLANNTSLSVSGSEAFCRDLVQTFLALSNTKIITAAQAQEFARAQQQFAESQKQSGAVGGKLNIPHPIITPLYEGHDGTGVR